MIPHVTDLKVRGYECDLYGHVNNSVYLNYLEVARGAFLESLGIDYNSIVRSGSGIWVTEVRIKYRSAAQNDDLLFVETRPVSLGAASMELEQTVKRRMRDSEPGENLLVAEAEIQLVWMNLNTRRPTRIPENLRDLFTPREKKV